MLLQEIFGMPTMRFITVYVAQGVITAIFLYLAIRILKRDKKRLNVIFAGFYLSMAIGLIDNFIYAPLKDEFIVSIMSVFVVFTIFLSMSFLVIFELILLKSEKVITSSKQILLIIVEVAIGFVLFILLFIPGAGIEINDSTSWSPEWTLPYYLYAMLATTGAAVIPILYLSLQILKQFEDAQLKKKWKSFIIGYLFLMGFTYSIFTSNYVASLGINIRTPIGLIGLVFIIAGGLLMYSGVGRQIEK